MKSAFAVDRPIFIGWIVQLWMDSAVTRHMNISLHLNGITIVFCLFGIGSSLAGITSHSFALITQHSSPGDAFVKRMAFGGAKRS
jgi:hypothetical protein